ncbi:2-oxoacid:ferredoxin oxidoreductase subunit gamma [Romboutsia weinsteinii]|uniref:2-oxoacid:ferredoxin oxidoreductase subunit gamma n=2 Tax=Romboutsia weinsteinii TaxID=2020949 RepID=A0A371J7N6_9FIRM|nr:2-oxoacid:ferredoxin oxidoreductase subunit gamma [Romboutsia weinsteinii]
MNMKTEIRLSGSGGQGLILAGVILAEGAILSNLNAVQSQSYGPEARGGASKAEVILSDKSINFPKIMDSDILISLTQKSFDEYSKHIKENSIVIVDSSIDVHGINAKVCKAPIIKTAEEVLKKPMTANIITLGVLSSVIQDVDKEHLKKAISKRVPKGTEELNMEAFEQGTKLIAAM